MTTPVAEPVESITEFRARVRAFFTSLPDVLAQVPGTVQRGKAYRRALCDAGLAGISYPTPLGGAGLSSDYETAFREESLGLLPGEDALFGLGLGMVVPTLRDHASGEIQQRFIPPALRGDEIWCQLYSEPGAGSDLAGLTTRAIRDGDEWVITGQKVWTSQAHIADFGILLARTDFDVPKHSGITMFALPMDQPGVTVRPLVQMTGAAEFNEVFLDEARVPADWVVGDVNGGWGLAVALLGHERTTLGRGQLTDDENKSKAGRSPLPFNGLVARAAEHDLLGDAVVRDDLAVAYTGERLVPWGTSRRLHPSVGKLWRTIQGRHCAQTAHLIGGAEAMAWEPDDADADYWAYHVLNCRGMSLGGGTDEIQKNTLGERVLGLPREPGPDRNTPFSDLPRN
ncbi:MAG: dehydrogenase [Acidimicrobiales bacterium]|nr:MAG: dehydrogenase [Acidimicrobiales bacterium]